MDDIPYGYCHCGCGRRTGISNHTSPKEGHRYGEPFLYCKNHAKRKREMYRPEDRGFSSPCWIWLLGRVRNRGYGYLARKDAEGNMRSTLAHRVIYEQHRGPIPEGLELDHLCRVRECVNPDHLEPVSHVVNLRRGAQPKLTPDLVRAIRANTADSAAVIAARLGVSNSAVAHARSGRSWKDVD